MRDSTSETVRALAVDGEGRVHFDTGPAGEGLIAKVDPGGATQLLRPGPPGGTDPLDQRARARGEISAAGRLAPDGTGGVLIAAGTKVVQENRGLVVVAGDASGAVGQAGASTGDGGPALSARFKNIRSIATDEAGNLLVADEIDRDRATVRIRFVNRSPEPVTLYSGTPQSVTVLPGDVDTIAGGPGETNAGDGGFAHSASLAGVPPALAVAGQTLYIGLSETGPASKSPVATVRAVNLGGSAIVAQGVTLEAGHIGTVASGKGGRAGAGPRGHAAGFSYLPGIGADAGGNLFLTDQAHNRVLRVDPAGTLSTFAGDERGRSGDPQEGGRAAAARLSRPYDVKTGPLGRVYISDQGHRRVRFVDQAGFIHSAPGNGLGLTWSCRSPSDGRPGGRLEPSRHGTPSGVVVDGRGTTLVAVSELGEIAAVDAGGTLLTVAGGISRAAGCRDRCARDGAEAAATAWLGRPTALAVRPGGGIYLFDAAVRRVRLLNLGARELRAHGVRVPGHTVRTVAGGGASSPGRDGAPALSAGFANRAALAADRQGNLFIADTDASRVRMVDPHGTITTVLGGPARANAFECCGAPAGVVTDASGNLYVSDILLTRVWLLNRGSAPVTVHGQTVAPGEVRRVAGTDVPGVGGDDGPALRAQLRFPMGMVVDGQANLYVADALDNSVRRVDAGGTITTVAGGQFGFNGDGLNARVTALSGPSALAFDACGNLLIADEGNDRLRRLNLRPPCTRTDTTRASGGTRRTGPIIAGAAAAGCAVALSAFMVRRRRREALRA